MFFLAREALPRRPCGPVQYRFEVTGAGVAVQTALTLEVDHVWVVDVRFVGKNHGPFDEPSQPLLTNSLPSTAPTPKKPGAPGLQTRDVRAKPACKTRVHGQRPPETSNEMGKPST